MKKLFKYSLIGLVSLIIILLVVIPFLPADTYRSEIEQQVGKALGMDVKLDELAFVTIPQPGLAITNITLAEKGRHIASVDSLRLHPRLSSLFSDTPEIRLMKLSGIRIRPNDIPRFIKPDESDESQSGSEQSALFIQKISADHSYLIVEQGNLEQWGPLSFEVDFHPKKGFKSLNLELEEKVFRVSIKPDGDDLAIKIRASEWSSLLFQDLTIDSLVMDGHIFSDRLHFKSIDIAAYSGKAKGNLILDWSDLWRLDSQVSVTSLNLGNLLKAKNNHSLDGSASGSFTLRSYANAVASLADNLEIRGDLLVQNGHIYETDLEKAARSLSKEWITGGQTPFDKFSTRFNMLPEKITLKKLFIQSSVLAANGDLKIISQKELNGEISVGLNDPTGVLTMPLMISGTVDEPQVRPTDAALAGGAVGTAVLGPGFGTAVGVKAGEVFSKIGSLFGSDEDEQETEEKKKDEQ
ncbi:MAG: AsmA family protein [Gammaproteobacteria bacterium]|nr:MAG: AsmA family protein [Gammaproteobacteria bacterium]